jgi:hypothetical protein
MRTFSWSTLPVTVMLALGWDLVKQYVAGADFPCCINDNPSSNVTYTDSVELDSADFLFTSGAKIGFRCSAWLWSGNGVTTYMLIK